MSINRKKSCEEGMVQKIDDTNELEVLKNGKFTSPKINTAGFFDRIIESQGN